MYPDQNQPGGVAPGPSNDFDFIVNPSGPNRSKSLIPGLKGNGLTGKLLLIIGIGVVLIIIMWVIGTIFGGAGANIERDVELVQTQHELARVADFGEDAFDQNLRNVSVNVSLTARTQEKQWLAFLGEEGRSLKDDELEKKARSKVDSDLESATTDGKFDEVYEKMLKTHMNAYASELQNMFNATKNTRERELLSQHFQQMELLIKQLQE